MKRSEWKRYVLGAATFATALSIGFVLQYGDALASRVGVDTAASGPDTMSKEDEQMLVPVTASIATPRSLSSPVAPTRDDDMFTLSTVPVDISVPSIAVPSADEPAPVTEIDMPKFDEQTVVLAAAETTDDMSLPSTALDADVLPAVKAPAASCDMQILARAVEMAMVDLTLDAPCHMETSFIIYHQGMSISAQTDDLGLASVTVPALNEHALFVLSFEEGASKIAQAFVPDMKEFDRAVLQWTGQHGFELHALLDNASYGQAGHVWNQTGGSAENGILTSFTNGDYAAEVYTYPAGQSSVTSDIRLNVETPISAANCGQAVSAQAIQIGANRTTNITDLKMTLPDCDAIGEYLVLKNVYEDLTLASK